MVYYHDGKRVVESSKSTKREYADLLLTQRVEGLPKAIPKQAETSTFISRIAKNQTPANTGAIAEKLVVLDLLNRGFHVFSATVPNGPCDLVFLDHRHRPHKVEVKMAKTQKNGRLIYDKPTKLHSYDVLAVVQDRETISYIPPLYDLNEQKNTEVLIEVPGEAVVHPPYILPNLAEVCANTPLYGGS